MSDTGNSGYYKQATAAASRGEFEYAKEVCQQAIKQFEHAGEERNASDAYHLLGEIAYRQGDLAGAESWYQKALAIDHRTGNERGAARTYNNLSAVADACGEYDVAEQWLWKSIRLKEKLTDERGLAASYHQLGNVAETRQDFGAAEKWYLKSLDIEGKLNSEIGVAMTCINLCGVAEKQGSKESAEKWRQEALQALGRLGQTSAAIKLGREVERQGDHEEALNLYRKALDIAKEHEDDEGQSLSYLYLGHLACVMGYFESSIECYEKSIEIDVRIHETARAANSSFSLGNICLGKTSDGRRDFRAARKWFRKSLELKQDATWRDSIKMHARLWHYRLLSVLSR